MSHQVLSEAMLEPSAELIQAAWRGAPLPLLLLRPIIFERERVVDFEVVSRNDAAESLPEGFEVGARLSQSLLDVDKAELVSRLTRLVEEGGIVSYESRFDESRLSRVYSLKASFVEGHVVLKLSDVTTARVNLSEHMKRLADEQELYRATFTDAPVGIAHLDLSGAFTQVNQRLITLLGYTREEFLQMNFSDLRSADSEDVLVVPWEREPGEESSEGGAGDAKRSRSERRYLRKDGAPIHATLTISPVLERGGGVRRYIAIIEDVSEVAAMNERLEETNRNKDEFLAVLGHELRNPLAALRHASILLSDPGEHDIRQIFRIIDRQTKHMGRLVDDLLDIGRIVRGKFDFREEQVDMRQIVSFAIDDLYAGSLPSQTLDADLEPGPLWVKGDSARLLQAVLNLLSNAVKYTPQDGHITVRLVREKDILRFTVQDDGVGLEESFLSKLFLPFEQAPQDLSRSAGGLGLGLALTSQIVKHHKGQIFAESPGRGQGSTFTIELPRVTSPQSPSDPPEAAPRRRLRFLVIEDNRDAAELLEMLLSARGHEVKLCFSGDRALDAAIGQVPDVVICDLGLPGKSGFEVARELKSDVRLEKTVLLALSGYGRAEDLRRCEEVGFASHLTKPADVNQIFSELDRLLHDGPHQSESE